MAISVPGRMNVQSNCSGATTICLAGGFLLVVGLGPSIHVETGISKSERTTTGILTLMTRPLPSLLLRALHAPDLSRDALVLASSGYFLYLALRTRAIIHINDLAKRDVTGRRFFLRVLGLGAAKNG
jgi:hypothetical protein